jgi:hypothetical protein
MRVNGGLSEILDEKRGRRQKGGLRKYNWGWWMWSKYIVHMHVTMKPDLWSPIHSSLWINIFCKTSLLTANNKKENDCVSYNLGWGNRMN